MEVGESENNGKEINIETPIINQENNKIDNNQEPENNENKINLNKKKIILKKNIRQLKSTNEKNENENENENEQIKDIEIEVNYNINNSNENKKDNQEINNIEISNNIEINNIDERNNSIEINNININEKNNELKLDENKNEGYLDDDLEDEDNKKLYLRVIKRMEKTYGVPIISAKIPGEPIEDIEIEENIRPLLLNNDGNIKQKNEIQNQPNIYNNNYNNNIKPKNEIPKQQNLYNIQNNTKNINISNNQKNVRNQNKTNPKNKNVITYEYQINKNTKELKPKVNNPLNNNINYNNYTSNYINKAQINNKNPKTKTIYQSEQKYIQKRSQLSNIYPTSNLNINSRYIPNRTPLGTNYRYSPIKYSYNNPSLNYQIKSNEKYKPLYNSRYLNNKINTNGKKANYVPIRNNKNINNSNTQSLYSGIPNMYYNKYNNNIISKTYYVSPNILNKSGNTKPNQNRPLNTNYKNIYISSLHQSIVNKKNPIMPKKRNIPYNNKNNKAGNILQKYKFSPSPYMANNQFKNLKKTSATPINQKRNIASNKSQTLYNGKNRNYNLSDFNDRKNYGKKNNNLAKSIDILSMSKKYTNFSPYKSLQSYQIKMDNNICNYNYSQNYGEYIPKPKTYVTYCIDSKYY